MTPNTTDSWSAMAMENAGSSSLFFFFYACLMNPAVFGFLFVLVFSLLWKSSEILQLVSDLVTGDNPLARTERDRELEGKLFDPEFSSRDGTPLIEQTRPKSGFPDFPFRHTMHFLS